ncbi:MAG: IS110 family transposase [Phycisphaerales bacterium]|nr:IS110 family transposase [Phycisphaerales bacterium]
MNYVGIDLHKKTITMCTVDQARNILNRKRFFCSDPQRILAFFEQQRPFQAVVEATASYDWLVKLIEPLADRLVLAHPRKLRIIAESTRKSDTLDAQVLAEFLALDMIPQAYRPTQRQRDHRVLVRHRHYLRGRLTSARNKIRRILANYNADRSDLFTNAGLAYLSSVTVSSADRFALDQLRQQWEQHRQQLKAIEQELMRFAASAPVHEAEARAVLDTIPGVGPVTVDVVVSELGDVRRFRSAKQVCAYAGLAPGQRESAGRTKELGITKEGSRLMRWVLTEAAWQLVNRTSRWRTVFETLAQRRGKKKAIIAIARRLLCVMVAMLRSGRRYQPAAA